MKLKVLNFTENKSLDSIDLDDAIFNSEVRKDILARVVKWQLAKARSGNHKAKGRSEVNHTTKKPFKQKGTGQARQGMKGVAQMRGGGVVFGPVVRDHFHNLPKKVRKLGLRSAIASKFKDNKIFVVNDLNISDVKTSDVMKKIKELNLNNALFVEHNGVDANNFRLSVKNIHKVDILPVVGLNVYDILQHDSLVFTVKGVEGIVERLNGK